MNLIRLNPHVRQRDLADRLNLAEQYIRKIIKRLKDGMFIERVGAKEWILGSKV